MKIEILGSGCAKCKQLQHNTEEALRIRSMEAEIVKVEDMQKIMSYGVMSTPGLVVDGTVKSTGKLLSPQEIAQLI